MPCQHGTVSRAAVSEPLTPGGPDEGAELSEALAAVGRAAGLHAVGVTTADVFEETRHHLLERRGQGLHGDMQFTYRNPERSTDPTRILPGARSLVVGAWSYRQSEADLPPTERRGRGRADRPDGWPATPVATTTPPCAGPSPGWPPTCRRLGWRATVVCDDNALVDRAAAHRAGLGWFGKNSLLLLPDAGSWFVLGSVVTDAPLRPTLPGAPAAHAHDGGCGSCSRCLTACPTGALVAPGVLDARRCLAWLVQAPGPFPVEFREALGDRIYGCDECQQVCPVNKMADRRHPPPPPPAGSAAAVDLLTVLEATDEQLLADHGRWYIPQRDPRYLRRNALVALGNIGDGSHPGTERALRRWLSAADPLLVEHAAWAAQRLGRDDLVARHP